MKKYFLDESIESLLDNFIKTKRSIYVYNIIIRYFHLYLAHERIYNKLRIDLKLDVDYYLKDLSDCYNKHMSYENIERSLNVINTEYFRVLRKKDHTFSYCIDIESNTELFRQFILYPWKDWTSGYVLEVGCGFGLYTFLFNILKKYYKLDNLNICSFDFDLHKIVKIEHLFITLNLIWKNKFICKDCARKETFEFLENNDIHLFYSETFSKRGVYRENYFYIMSNLLNNFKYTIKPTIIFPYDFIINGEKWTTKDYVEYLEDKDSNNHFIEGFLINGKYQYLTGYDVDEETKEINNYIKTRFKDRVFFRWEE